MMSKMYALFDSVSIAQKSSGACNQLFNGGLLCLRRRAGLEARVPCRTFRESAALHARAANIPLWTRWCGLRRSQVSLG